MRKGRKGVNAVAGLFDADAVLVIEIRFGDGRVVDARAANGHQPVFHVPGQRLAGDGKAARGQLHRARFQVT